MVGMYHSHHTSLTRSPTGCSARSSSVTTPSPPACEASTGVRSRWSLNDSGTIGFSLNGKSFPATEPYVAKQGDKVIVHYMNEGLMAHPMHLHGQTSTVIAKDGYPLPDGPATRATRQHRTRRALTVRLRDGSPARGCGTATS